MPATECSNDMDDIYIYINIYIYIYIEEFNLNKK